MQNSHNKLLSEKIQLEDGKGEKANKSILILV